MTGALAITPGITDIGVAEPIASINAKSASRINMVFNLLDFDGPYFSGLVL